MQYLFDEAEYKAMAADRKTLEEQIRAQYAEKVKQGNDLFTAEVTQLVRRYCDVLESRFMYGEIRDLIIAIKDSAKKNLIP